MFGLTLRASLPGLFIGHLPWAVRHEPRERRGFPPAALTGFDFRLSELIGMLLSDIAAHAGPGDGDDRLADAGHHLIAIADGGERGFLSHVRGLYLRHAGTYIASLEDLLRICDEGPRFWVKDVRAHMENVSEYTTSVECCIPSDVRGGRSWQEALDAARMLVGKFGDLLSWWPEIREASAEVRFENLSVRA